MDAEKESPGAGYAKEKRVLWVSIGSSGGELEAVRDEGTRGVSRRGLVDQKRGREGWTVGL